MGGRSRSRSNSSRGYNSSHNSSNKTSQTRSNESKSGLGWVALSFGTGWLTSSFFHLLIIN